eukprot:gnl/MRDRNA2_/MRDRNA2_105759_c0_seq1.p1 gnl/MRDRNA2_/MRDRNA2_105759_c0~~gnl/MRDRNA2_/MRDRNA2_105759_c0_seq1.p1  ORF type:complete len:611 (+),score=159.75 gnl/MRDRNA2_/MRDRNA2_105759_c0_seq1:79-1911(+)
MQCTCFCAAVVSTFLWRGLGIKDEPAKAEGKFLDRQPSTSGHWQYVWVPDVQEQQQKGNPGATHRREEHTEEHEENRQDEHQEKHEEEHGKPRDDLTKLKNSAHEAIEVVNAIAKALQVPLDTQTEIHADQLHAPKGHQPAMQRENQADQVETPKNTSQPPVMQTEIKAAQLNTPKDTGHPPAMQTENQGNELHIPKDAAHPPVTQLSLPNDATHSPVMQTQDKADNQNPKESRASNANLGETGQRHMPTDVVPSPVAQKEETARSTIRSEKREEVSNQNVKEDRETGTVPAKEMFAGNSGGQQSTRREDVQKSDATRQLPELQLPEQEDSSEEDHADDVAYQAGAALVSTAQHRAPPAQTRVQDLEKIILQKQDELVELHKQHDAALDAMKKTQEESLQSYRSPKGTAGFNGDPSAIANTTRQGHPTRIPPAQQAPEDTAILQKKSDAKAVQAKVHGKHVGEEEVRPNPEEEIKKEYEATEAEMEHERQKTREKLESVATKADALKSAQDGINSRARDTYNKLVALKKSEMDTADSAVKVLGKAFYTGLDTHKQIVEDAQTLHDNTKNTLLKVQSKVNGVFREGQKMVAALNNPVNGEEIGSETASSSQ